MSEGQELTAADRFHAHLDQCQQCSSRPMDLCVTGGELLRQAATETAPQTGWPLQCPVCGNDGPRFTREHQLTDHLRAVHNYG